MHTRVPGYPGTQGVGSSTTSSCCTNCNTGEGTCRGGAGKGLRGLRGSQLWGLLGGGGGWGSDRGPGRGWGGE
eukprot:407720-Rhodomonas_salina.1